MLVDRANAEREKWVAAINTTFEHIGGVRFDSIHCVSIFLDIMQPVFNQTHNAGVT